MPDRDENEFHGRVMVIGLDGATWDLIHPWIGRGLLPNLARLVSNGVSANMLSELPPSSVPNWPAFMTGKNAGNHGCFWWLQRDKSGFQDRLPIDAHAVHGDTIWSYLSANDKKVIIQNVPVTYPVEPVNGVMISGLLTPSNAEDFVYPPSLKPELDKYVGGYHIYPPGAFIHGQEEKFIQGQIANIEQHCTTAEHLIDSHEWDFLMLVLGPTDEAAHKIWHYMDPKHRRYKPNEDQGLQDGLLRIYTAADEAIGALARSLKPEDTLIIMSDHGFGPVDSFFHVNNWLMREGYLKLKRTGTTSLKQALYQVGFTPTRIYPLGKRILSYVRNARALGQRLDPGRQGAKTPLRRIFLTTEDIDWTRTRAFASGFLFAQIFINLQGREPQGIVTPGDYEPLRQELISKLTAVKNPFTTQLHYADVKRREVLYHGPYIETIPDLLCIPRDLVSADSGMGFRSNKLFDRDTSLSGTHREQGIFIISGPGVRHGEQISPIRIFDLAPTIYYRLQLPVPNDLDGKVISSAFDNGDKIEGNIRYIAAQASRKDDVTSLSTAEEDSIKKRLQDLGYLN